MSKRWLIEEINECDQCPSFLMHTNGTWECRRLDREMDERVVYHNGGCLTTRKPTQPEDCPLPTEKDVVVVERSFTNAEELVALLNEIKRGLADMSHELVRIVIERVK